MDDTERVLGCRRPESSNMFNSKRHRFRLLAAVLLALGGVAAGAAGARTTLAGAPALLSINTSNVDFGDVDVGSTKQLSVGITNTASDAVEITRVDASAPQPPFTLDASGCATTLAPQSYCVAVIRFAPTGAGPFSATSSFTLNGSRFSDRFTVSLKGCGVTRINLCSVEAPDGTLVLGDPTTTAAPTTTPTPTTTATTTPTATTAPSGGQPSGGQPSGEQPSGGPGSGVPADAVVHPLTGVAFADPANYTPRPALAVKIDNAAGALPQTGLNQADIVYEEIVEGGATRFAAVFNSTDSNPVGPIRSARSQDVDLLSSLDTPILACSGANTGVNDALAATGWTVLTEGDGMFRADDRAAPHNLYANTTELYTAADTAGDTDTGDAVPQFQYAEPGADIAGTPVTAIDVRVGQVEVRWLWDELTNRYLRMQHGEPHLLTDGQAATDTVIVIVTDYTDSDADPASPEAVTVGSGDVVVYTAGHKIEGIWTRESATDPFLLEAAGAPILITPGHTWIELVNVADYDLADDDTTSA